MEATRLQISSRLKSLMAYPKLAGPRPRLLVLESQYWIDRACARAARRLGWDIEQIPTRMEGVLPRELVARLVETLAEFRPDFVLTVNLSGMDERGLFAGLFEDLGIPLVAWFVDDPRTILLDRDRYGSPLSIALVWERAYVPYLRARKFGAVHWMPLAADLDLFDGEPGESWDGPPTFVGNSMVESALQELAWIKERPVLHEMVCHAFREGRVTRAHFGRGLGAMLGEDAVVHLDEHERRHAELYCFVEGTRRLRESTVAALVHQGLWVHGDTHWTAVTSQSLPYVRYETDLAAHYRRCPVNLNITSLQMPTALNQRAFDCPAAGGFLLGDAQSDVEDLFDPASEAVTYANVEEAAEKLRYYAAHPDARRAIVLKARRRVLAEHTYTHRLEQIKDLVRDQIGS